MRKNLEQNRFLNAYANSRLTIEFITEKSNITSIILAAGEGFLTSDANLGKILLVKAGVTVVNNSIGTYETKDKIEEETVKEETDKNQGYLR